MGMNGKYSNVVGTTDVSKKKKIKINTFVKNENKSRLYNKIYNKMINRLKIEKKNDRR